ncbi:MAG: class I SAM-dependent methyltransferase [Chloroflexi bacterium]|nr:class I SAM-dependent methyltransferase [Chloroflexota bacterium]
MYDKFSSVYDKFVNWQSRLAYEMPFIETQLGSLGREKSEVHILDAACGTGMHVIELAQRGYKASGADISAPMILKAIENAVTFNVRAEFKAAGFGKLSKAFVEKKNGRLFDTVLVLGNSIPHILERPALDAALEDLRACLAPGGFLLIQNRNFDAILEQRLRWMEPQSQRGYDGEWLFLRFYDFKPDGRIGFNIITLHRAEMSEWQQDVECTELFPWSSDVLSEALYGAGFSRITRFGDMEGNPYSHSASGNLVIRADV